MPINALLHLAKMSSMSPLTAQIIFWAFVAQGNTRIASYLQELTELYKPAATVYYISDYRLQGR